MSIESSWREVSTESISADVVGSIPCTNRDLGNFKATKEKF